MTLDQTTILPAAMALFVIAVGVHLINRKPKMKGYTKAYAELSEWIEYASSYSELAYFGEMVDDFHDKYFDGKNGDAYALYKDLCAGLQTRYEELKAFEKPVIGTAKRI